MQAEADDRASIDDIYRINVRNAEGKMIPLRSLVEMRVVVGPPALIRYNNLRAVTVQGSPGARHLLRAGAQGDGGGRGADAAGRAMPANGPTPRSRRSAPRARPP